MLQVIVGDEDEAAVVTLPFMLNVPELASKWDPFVNVVAEIDTCQPELVPVASTTEKLWSPEFMSTTDEAAAESAVDHESAVGGVPSTDAA